MTRALRALPAAALVAITLATYGSGLRNGFVWDDHRVVETDEAVRPSTLRAAFTSPDVLWRSDPAAYYRPLARATYVLDRRLFGLDPLPYHLENILLHAAAAVALFFLGRRLVGATGPAFAGALLFAVHPVTAEVVNFVTARNNILVALFTLSSLLVYLRARRERPALALLGALLFVLGLLSKETAFMLLPFLAVLELTAAPEDRRSVRQATTLLAPYAGAAAVYLAARASVLPALLGARPTLGGVAAALGRDLHIVPEYLSLLLFPSGLTIHHAEPDAYFSSAATLVAAWIAIGTGLALLLYRSRPATLLGLLWFAVNFLPVSTIIPMPSASIAERHLYIPFVGLALVAADQLARLHEAIRRPRAIGAAVAAVAVALAIVTARRNLDWKDDIALFSSAIRVDPSSSDARFDYSLALDARGDTEGARRQWEQTVAIAPAHLGSLSRLGTYWAERGRLDLAAGYFARVLAANPRDVETRFNMGLLFEKLHRPREALEQYDAFLALSPVDYPELAARVEERVRTLRAALRERAP